MRKILTSFFYEWIFQYEIVQDRENRPTTQLASFCCFVHFLSAIATERFFNVFDVFDNNNIWTRLSYTDPFWLGWISMIFFFKYIHSSLHWKYTVQYLKKKHLLEVSTVWYFFQTTSSVLNKIEWSHSHAINPKGNYRYVNTILYRQLEMCVIKLNRSIF